MKHSARVARKVDCRPVSRSTKRSPRSARVCDCRRGWSRIAPIPKAVLPPLHVPEWQLVYPGLDHTINQDGIDFVSERLQVLTRVAWQKIIDRALSGAA